MSSFYYYYFLIRHYSYNIYFVFWSNIATTYCNSVVSFADPYANFGLKIQDKESKKIKKRNKIKKNDSDKIIKFENYLKN